MQRNVQQQKILMLRAIFFLIYNFIKFMFLFASFLFVLQDLQLK